MVKPLEMIILQKRKRSYAVPINAFLQRQKETCLYMLNVHLHLYNFFRDRSYPYEILVNLLDYVLLLAFVLQLSLFVFKLATCTRCGSALFFFFFCYKHLSLVSGEEKDGILIASFSSI